MARALAVNAMAISFFTDSFLQRPLREANISRCWFVAPQAPTAPLQYLVVRSDADVLMASAVIHGGNPLRRRLFPLGRGQWDNDRPIAGLPF